jgi:hypothetical protein
MPLFRRSRERPASLQFTVGEHNHRVVVGGADRGVAVLDELRGYVESVTGTAAAPGPDGRDSVAVLSAKMDRAEMVVDAVAVVLLAIQELVERGVLAAGAIAPEPVVQRASQRAGHYAYIQASHERAGVLMAWLESADAVLREHGVAVLRPAAAGRGTLTRLG